MKYIIKPDIFSKYPELRVGVVVGKGLEIKKTDGYLRGLIKENIEKFLNNLSGSNLLDQPNISAWRETYKSFGVKPKKYKPTAEALLRRVINDHPLPNINTAVDAYLAVELLYLLPIGGYDLSKITGDIVLRISDGNEIFYPLGGAEPEYTKVGEVIYADNKSVLTRKWNYKDADHTKITEQSRDIILATEAAYKIIKDDDIKGTVEKIVEYESKFCGGNCKSYFLDINNQEVEL